MPQHLQELIAAAKENKIGMPLRRQTILAITEKEAEEIKETHNETIFAVNMMLEMSSDAICFDAGDMTYFDGIKIIPDLVRLPFPVVWVEMKVTNFIYGFLMQEETGKIGVQVWLMQNKRWIYISSFIRCNIEDKIISKKLEEKRIKDLGINKSENPNSSIFSLVAAFLSALNCGNVQKKEIKPPEKVQKKRQKQGKQPIWSYWVLELKPTSRSGEAQGGTHASPRVHLRRGHIREYRPSEYTWVQPCVVGQGPGIVHKDYKLTA